LRCALCCFMLPNSICQYAPCINPTVPFVCRKAFFSGAMAADTAPKQATQVTALSLPASSCTIAVMVFVVRELWELTHIRLWDPQVKKGHYAMLQGHPCKVSPPQHTSPYPRYLPLNRITASDHCTIHRSIDVPSLITLSCDVVCAG